MADETTRLRRMTEAFSKLTLDQRIGLAAMVFFIALGLVGVVYFTSQESYQTLYTGMNPEDAGTLAGKLKAQKVVYRLESGGTAIAVPASQIDELRVQLAAEGFPQSGKIGFEIFDRTNFGLSEFIEQVNFRRALEGEISRSIASLQEVATARVHLVLPKTALYKEQEEAAKASVVVKLKTGRGLAKESIIGITNMMASAVPGLKPENISIMDVRGKVLSVPLKEEAVPGLSKPELEAKASMEDELNAKVVSILEPVVGTGRVSARTSVELNLDQVEETAELYDPDKAAVSRRQVNREYTGGSPGIGGVVGVPGNQPAAPQNPVQATASLSGERNKQEETTQFEVPRTVRRAVQGRGQIKKLSIAVIVDDKGVPGQDSKGQKTLTYTARTPQEIQKIKDLVMAAVGYNSNRGDMVTVENLSFQTMEAPAEEPERIWRSYYFDYVQPNSRYIFIAILVLLLYLTMFRPFQRRIFRVITSEHIPTGVSAPLLLPETGVPGTLSGAIPEGLPGRAGAEGLPETLPATELRTPGMYQAAAENIPRRLSEVEKDLEAQLENELAASEINIDAKKSAVLKKRISQMAADNPEGIAQLLRSWFYKAES